MLTNKGKLTKRGVGDSNHVPDSATGSEGCEDGDISPPPSSEKLQCLETLRHRRELREEQAKKGGPVGEIVVPNSQPDDSYLGEYPDDPAEVPSPSSSEEGLAPASQPLTDNHEAEVAFLISLIEATPCSKSFASGLKQTLISKLKILGKTHRDLKDKFALLHQREIRNSSEDRDYTSRRIDQLSNQFLDFKADVKGEISKITSVLPELCEAGKAKYLDAARRALSPGILVAQKQGERVVPHAPAGSRGRFVLSGAHGLRSNTTSANSSFFRNNNLPFVLLYPISRRSSSGNSSSGAAAPPTSAKNRNTTTTSTIMAEEKREDGGGDARNEKYSSRQQEEEGEILRASIVDDAVAAGLEEDGEKMPIDTFRRMRDFLIQYFTTDAEGKKLGLQLSFDHFRRLKKKGMGFFIQGGSQAEDVVARLEDLFFQQKDQLSFPFRGFEVFKKSKPLARVRFDNIPRCALISSDDDSAVSRDGDNLEFWERVFIKKLVQSNSTLRNANVELYCRSDKNTTAGRINDADARSSSPKGRVLYFGQKNGFSAEVIGNEALIELVLGFRGVCNLGDHIKIRCSEDIIHPGSSCYLCRAAGHLQRDCPRRRPPNNDDERL